MSGEAVVITSAVVGTVVVLALLVVFWYIYKKKEFKLPGRHNKPVTPVVNVSYLNNDEDKESPVVINTGNNESIEVASIAYSRASFNLLDEMQLHMETLTRTPYAYGDKLPDSVSEIYQSQPQSLERGISEFQKYDNEFECDQYVPKKIDSMKEISAQAKVHDYTDIDGGGITIVFDDHKSNSENVQYADSDTEPEESSDYDYNYAYEHTQDNDSGLGKKNEYDELSNVSEERIEQSNNKRVNEYNVMDSPKLQKVFASDHHSPDPLPVAQNSSDLNKNNNGELINGGMLIKLTSSDKSPVYSAVAENSSNGWLPEYTKLNKT